MEFPQVIGNDFIKDELSKENASQKDPKNEDLIKFSKPISPLVKGWTYPTFYQEGNPSRPKLRFRKEPFEDIDRVFKDLYPKNGQGGFVVAGGSVLRALQYNGPGGQFIDHLKEVNADVDLFAVGLKPKQGEKMIKDFIDSQNRYDTNIAKVFRTRGAITVINSAVNVQFITRNYRNKSAVVHNFDIPACALLWDGTDVLTTRLGCFTFTMGVFPLILTRFRGRAEMRYQKYFEKGFGIIITQADHKKVLMSVEESYPVCFGKLTFRPAPSGHMAPNHFQCNSCDVKIHGSIIESYTSYSSHTAYMEDGEDMKANIRMLVSGGYTSLWVLDDCGNWVYPISQCTNLLSTLINILTEVTVSTITKYLKYIPQGLDPLPLIYYAIEQKKIDDGDLLEMDPKIDHDLKHMLAPKIVSFIRENSADLIDPIFVWREENELTMSEMPKSQLPAWFGKYYLADE